LTKLQGGPGEGSREPAMARNVVVYSTPLCAPCEHLKQYLRSRGVSFVVRDIMMDEEAAIFLEDRGIRSTPVLAVDDALVVGFDRKRVDELLGLA
jgi:glutaredoxin-like protein NrdH